MTDASTKEPLFVHTDGTAGPYFMIPVRQLDAVQALLNKNKVSHWVDESAIALDGQNYIAVVNLGRSGDAKKVQAILDTAN